jgi:N-acetylmuramoyl-L-alanine amidase
VFHGEGDASKALAETIASNLKAKGEKVRRVAHHTGTQNTSGMRIMKGHNSDESWKICTEYAFIDNARDEKRAGDPENIRKFASAIAAGINTHAIAKGYQLPSESSTVAVAPPAATPNMPKPTAQQRA